MKRVYESSVRIIMAYPGPLSVGWMRYNKGDTPNRIRANPIRKNMAISKLVGAAGCA